MVSLQSTIAEGLLVHLTPSVEVEWLRKVLIDLKMQVGVLQWVNKVPQVSNEVSQ